MKRWVGVDLILGVAFAVWWISSEIGRLGASSPGLVVGFALLVGLIALSIATIRLFPWAAVVLTVVLLVVLWIPSFALQANTWPAIVGLLYVSVCSGFVHNRSAALALLAPSTGCGLSVAWQIHIGSFDSEGSPVLAMAMAAAFVVAGVAALVIRVVARRNRPQDQAALA